MESQPLVAGEFRDGQRQQWDKGAEGWRKWSGLIDGAASEVSQRMVELAGVEPGGRVLMSPRGTATEAHGGGAAGGEGRVVATDISAEMLAFGRERAARPGSRTSSSSSRRRPAWISRPRASMRRYRAWGSSLSPRGRPRPRGYVFLVPGSRMAISSWGPPERVPFIAVPMGTAMRRSGSIRPRRGRPARSRARHRRRWGAARGRRVLRRRG